MSSHNTVHPRSIHRVPASHCLQRKPFSLDSLVILDLASFHDLYTRVPASHCPQCKPSPWTLPWAEADVPSLVLMLPQHQAPKTCTLASESLAPKLPHQWSNLDSLICYPEPASNIRLEEPHQMAVSANHNLGGCVIQLRSYLTDIIWKIIGGFRVITPFTSAFLKYNCRYFYQDNWAKILKFWFFKGFMMTRPQHYFYNTYMNIIQFSYKNIVGT